MQHPRGPTRTGAAKQCGDPGAELRVGERFGQHIVAAAVEQPDPVKLIDPGGQDDHRCVGVDTAGEPVAAADRVD
jgi:hypothetical protein